MGGFVRCYYIKCVYNTAKEDGKRGLDPSYGLCRRQIKGDKITIGSNRQCSSFQDGI